MYKVLIQRKSTPSITKNKMNKLNTIFKNDSFASPYIENFQLFDENVNIALSLNGNEKIKTIKTKLNNYELISFNEVLAIYDHILQQSKMKLESEKAQKEKIEKEKIEKMEKEKMEKEKIEKMEKEKIEKMEKEKIEKERLKALLPINKKDKYMPEKFKSQYHPKQLYHGGSYLDE